MGLAVAVCKYGAILAAAAAVLVGLLLNGTLRDAGLTRLLASERMTGTFPFLNSDPPNFRFQDMPALSGRVAVVTGANVGLGYFSALHLARHGATVLLGCRTPKKCSAAADEINGNLTDAPVHGGRAQALQLDLSSMASVQDFASAVLEASGGSVDQLMLNAGMMTTDYQLSADGIESTWATNHVGHHLLFKLLESSVVAAATSHGHATVTVVSSDMHFEPQASVLLSLDAVNNKDEHSGVGRYSTTKLANVLFAVEAQKRHMEVPVYINSVHPGMVNTEFVDNWKGYTDMLGTTFGPIAFELWKRFFEAAGWDSETAALTQLYTSCSPEVAAKDFRGRYFHPIARVTGTSHLVTDGNAKLLWDFTEELLSTKLTK